MGHVAWAAEGRERQSHEAQRASGPLDFQWKIMPDARRCMAVWCHDKRGDCREVARHRWSTVVRLLSNVLQPEVGVGFIKELKVYVWSNLKYK